MDQHLLMSQHHSPSFLVHCVGHLEIFNYVVYVCMIIPQHIQSVYTATILCNSALTCLEGSACVKYIIRYTLTDQKWIVCLSPFLPIPSRNTACLMNPLNFLVYPAGVVIGYLTHVHTSEHDPSSHWQSHNYTNTA